MNRLRLCHAEFALRRVRMRRVPGHRQLVDERQLHGAQRAVDVDVEAPPQADQLLALGRGSRCAGERRRQRLALSTARQSAAVPVGRGELR